MTYRELERLYAKVDWSDPDSVREYEEKAKEYRKQKDEEGKNNG